VSTAHAANGGHSGKRTRVLVADDDATCRALTEHTLNALGVEIDVVKDGEEAVQAFASGLYDLVLMDCHMPKLDGFGAALLIREIETRGRRVPIVALTGTAVGLELERCREVGMDGHLDKLSGPQELRQALSDLLAQIATAAQTGDASEQGANGSPHGPNGAHGSAAARGAASRTLDCLDLSVLESLKEFSTPDDDLIRELRASFESNLAQQLPQLEQAARAADAGVVRFIAHRLRSTCGNLGARRMQFICERLEDLGRDGVTVGAIELIDDLAREFTHACVALDEWIRTEHT
jgi:CheY-like chemotaxis protein/HPt (histidine-containing phosphotransfer) domain-containing protein